jgi:hypothetical protein
VLCRGRPGAWERLRGREVGVGDVRDECVGPAQPEAEDHQAHPQHRVFFPGTAGTAVWRKSSTEIVESGVSSSEKSIIGYHRLLSRQRRRPASKDHRRLAGVGSHRMPVPRISAIIRPVHTHVGIGGVPANPDVRRGRCAVLARQHRDWSGSGERVAEDFRAAASDAISSRSVFDQRLLTAHLRTRQPADETSAARQCSGWT